MFMEVLNGMDINLEDFYKNLNPSNQYYFILIHHENKNVVDYTEELGENYKKLAIAIVRDENHEEINLYQKNLEETLPGLHNLIQSGKIILPKIFDDLSTLDTDNTKGFINIPPLMEGLIMKVKDNTSNRNLILNDISERITPGNMLR